MLEVWCKRHYLSNAKDGTVKLFRFVLILFSCVLVMSACAPAQTGMTKIPGSQLTTVPTGTITPDWFNIEMTDVKTGKTFAMNDYAGKVVLLETMAIWCPSCVIEATQVKKLREALGNPEDLISVTLDVDSHEDEATLKEFVSSYRFDWQFAVAPLLVERALGNLYSAEYL